MINSTKFSTLLIAALMMVMFTAFFAVSAIAAADTTQPMIVSVSPTNNEVSIATHDSVTVQFNKPMDPATINKNTFVVMQRTTPADGSVQSQYRTTTISGAVTYDPSTYIATFTPTDPSALQPSYNPLQPSQQYGNVFTVTLTSGITDLAGNALSQDYMWSFTTGGDNFNTGSSTSQSNQNSTNTSAPAIIPAPISTQPPANAGPLTAAPATAGSWFTSIWFIGGILLLLLIALLIVFNMRPARQKTTQKSAYTARADPFGDVHPVAELEGIGPVYKKGLQAMGIKNTHQLWKANTTKVARVIGAPLSSVKSWQNMAELASVKGIGPQYAELLERSGIHSIVQLKESDPNKVLALIREKQDSLKINIQGNSPGITTVQNWIDEARDQRYAVSEGQTA